MKTKLIALVAIAAGTVASVPVDISAGSEFLVDPAEGDLLIADGKAKVSDSTSLQAPSKKEKTTKVRVLCDCAHGKPNDVVELPDSVAKQAEKGGLVDTDKSAVAYAESLKRDS